MNAKRKSGGNRKGNVPEAAPRGQINELFSHWTSQFDKQDRLPEKDPAEMLKHQLFNAILSCDSEGLKDAIAQGADVNARLYYSRKVMHLSDWRSKMKHPEGRLIESLFKKQFTGLTPLMLAVDARSLEMVRILAESGADIDAKDRNGSTVLRRAYLKQEKEIVDYLRSRGARLY